MKNTNDSNEKKRKRYKVIVYSAANIVNNKNFMDWKEKINEITGNYLC